MPRAISTVYSTSNSLVYSCCPSSRSVSVTSTFVLNCTRAQYLRLLRAQVELELLEMPTLERRIAQRRDHRHHVVLELGHPVVQQPRELVARQRCNSEQ